MDYTVAVRSFTEVRIKNEHDTFWRSYQQAFFKQVQQEKQSRPQSSPNQRQLGEEAPALVLEKQNSREEEAKQNQQGTSMIASNLQPEMKEIDPHDESSAIQAQTSIQESPQLAEPSLTSTPSILLSQIRKQEDQLRCSPPNIQASQGHAQQEQQEEVQEVDGCSFYTIQDPSSSSLRNASSNQPPNQHQSQQTKLESIPNQLSIIINQQQTQNQPNQPIKQDTYENSSPVCEQDEGRSRLESVEVADRNGDSSLVKEAHQKQESQQNYDAEYALYERKFDEFMNQPYLSKKQISESCVEENYLQTSQIQFQSENQLNQHQEEEKNDPKENSKRKQDYIQQYESDFLKQQEKVQELDQNRSNEFERPSISTIDQMIAQNETEIDQIVDNFKEYIQAATQNCVSCASAKRQNEIIKQQIEELTSERDTIATKSQQAISLLRKERQQSNKVIFQLKAALQSLKEELAKTKEKVTVQTNITRTTSTKNIQTFNQSNEEEEEQPISTHPFDKNSQQNDADYESQKNSSEQEEEKEEEQQGEEDDESSSEESSNIKIQQDVSVPNTDLPDQNECEQEEKEQTNE